MDHNVLQHIHNKKIQKKIVTVVKYNSVFDRLSARVNDVSSTH